MAQRHRRKNAATHPSETSGETEPGIGPPTTYSRLMGPGHPNRAGQLLGIVAVSAAAALGSQHVSPWGPVLQIPTRLRGHPHSRKPGRVLEPLGEFSDTRPQDIWPVHAQSASTAVFDAAESPEASPVTHRSQVGDSNSHLGSYRGNPRHVAEWRPAPSSSRHRHWSFHFSLEHCSPCNRSDEHHGRVSERTPACARSATNDLSSAAKTSKTHEPHP